MKAAFRQAYKLTDRVLEHGGDEKSRVRWSGASALTIVVEQLEPFETQEMWVSFKDYHSKVE